MSDNVEESGKVIGYLVFAQRQSNALQYTNETDALDDCKTVASSAAGGQTVTQCPKKVKRTKGRGGHMGLMYGGGEAKKVGGRTS